MGLEISIIICCNSVIGIYVCNSMHLYKYKSMYVHMGVCIHVYICVCLRMYLHKH